MVKNVFKKLGKKQKNNKGFSLVELIVVIAIMAVLVGVLAPQLIKYVEKSREATDIQNADSIATTVKAYYADVENADNVTVKLTKAAAPVVTVGATEDTGKKCLTGSGLDATQLKGSGWNDGITITYNGTSGKITYKLSSSYYKADNAESISKNE